ncbi:TRAP transporter small permease [Paracoccus seriniphilus]|uniref:TRAP transporter small permease protein n=1 Tax=Paracoccus seriniphilus TaxID=184748 RepID=A0A239Q1B9_9RHOB|nr:TRAP transporter small permease [Paracoccus seriniphilus]WCR15883.1 TRAP transporter small permease [Paracoccus seriniphilus]SNT76304.1 TRAP-type C4-dicarboxylate transport system, small permease component [Paracoccus seriniphilus]
MSGENIDFEEITDDISVVRPEDLPALALFTFLIVIVALQFVTRYVLNDSISWTEEVARYCLIALTFLGTAICSRRGTHLALGLVYRHVPAGAVKPLALITEALTCGFFIWLTLIGTHMMKRTAAQMMISVPVPKSALYTVITLSCALTALYCAINLLRIARQSPDQIAMSRLGAV